ncbi:MAG TPA: hypothetical protein VFI31_17540 [Pirellulales bacterium]|nr:hypothetical protein [Pirellulales bacterium]
MSRFFVRVALSAGICISLVAATSAVEQEITARPLPSASQSKILAALDQSTDCDFRERPFSEVISYFKQKHEIEIVLDAKALTDAGVGTDTPITETLQKITLRSALKLLIGQLDLTYVVRDGYLLITSKTEAEGKLSFKVYPVEDLVTLDSPFRPALPKPADRHDSPIEGEVINHGGLMGSGFGGATGWRDEAGDFSNLIDVIQSTVPPTTWDEVGGPGSITANPNSQAIAVSQTDEVHEEIVGLLAALRRVRDEQRAAAKPLAPAPPEAPEKKTGLQVRAYRLMRGTVSQSKGGWRPPVQPVGDVRPPRSKQTSDHTKDQPQPSGEGGASNDAAPGKQREPTKEAPPAAEAADKAAIAKARDEKLASLAETIARLVPEMIEPESWQPSGEGMIRAVGEAVVVRNTEEVQRRVATLMVELVPDCVPLGFTGPWGPWKVAFQPGQGRPRLQPATTANWPYQAEPRPSGAKALIEESLLEKCDVQFDQLPLVDALRPLAKPKQVQVYIDHKALSDAGVGTDTPVTCSVKGVSYKTALKLLLEELDLTYLVRNEVLFITSKTDAESMLTIKVYPVFDLVLRPANAPPGRPGLGFASLIDDIQTNIAPTTWDDVGGPGAIKSFTNSAALVISQTTETHEEIAEYLRALREVAAIQNVNQ